METRLRVARDLSVAPGDDSTAGWPMPPPLALTLEIAAPVTPDAVSAGRGTDRRACAIRRAARHAT